MCNYDKWNVAEIVCYLYGNPWYYLASLGSYKALNGIKMSNYLLNTLGYLVGKVSDTPQRYWKRSPYCRKVWWSSILGPPSTIKLEMGRTELAPVATDITQWSWTQHEKKELMGCKAVSSERRRAIEAPISNLKNRYMKRFQFMGVALRANGLLDYDQQITSFLPNIQHTTALTELIWGHVISKDTCSCSFICIYEGNICIFKKISVKTIWLDRWNV